MYTRNIMYVAPCVCTNTCASF